MNPGHGPTMKGSLRRRALLATTTLRSAMSISVDVHLLSGKTETLEVDVDDSVESLRRRAQSALKAGNGRLLNSSGEVLDGASTIEEARLQNGDVLTLHMKQVALVAAKRRGCLGIRCNAG